MWSAVVTLENTAESVEVRNHSHNICNLVWNNNSWELSLGLVNLK